jgi:hypothetical protein
MHQKHLRVAADREAAIVKLDDANARLRKDLERAALKAKQSTHTSMSANERELQQELDKCMVIDPMMHRLAIDFAQEFAEMLDLQVTIQKPTALQMFTQ